MDEWIRNGDMVLRQEEKLRERESGEDADDVGQSASPLGIGLGAPSPPRIETLILEDLEQAVRDYGIDLGIRSRSKR